MRRKMKITDEKKTRENGPAGKKMGKNKDKEIL